MFKNIIFSLKTSQPLNLLSLSTKVNCSNLLKTKPIHKSTIHNIYSSSFSSTSPNDPSQNSANTLLELYHELMTLSKGQEYEIPARDLTNETLKLELDKISILEKQKNLNEAHKKLLLLLLKAANRSIQLDHFTLASLVKKYANVLYLQGNDLDALKLYKRVLELFNNETDNSSRLLAETYYEMAQIQEGLDELTEAQDHFQRALDLAIKSFGEQDLDTAKYYLGLGVSISSQGDVEKAVEYVNKALEIQSNLLGESNPELVKSYIELGMIYQAWNKDSEAMDVYEKCLDLLAEAPETGEYDEDLVNVYEFIGDIFTNEGRWEDAATYFGEAAQVREEIYEKVSEKSQKEYKALGNLYEKIAECQIELQEFDKAKGNYIRALECLKEVFAEGSEELLSSYHQVANSAVQSGNNKEALAYYKEGLKGYVEARQKEGKIMFDIKEDFEVITLYNMIGEMELRVGEYEKAIENSEEVLRFYLKNKLYARIEEVYERIGKANEKLGRNEEAKEIYWKALEEHLEYFGKDHPAVNKFSEVLRDLYERDEKSEKIEELEKLLGKYKDEVVPPIKF